MDRKVGRAYQKKNEQNPFCFDMFSILFILSWIQLCWSHISHTLHRAACAFRSLFTRTLKVSALNAILSPNCIHFRPLHLGKVARCCKNCWPFNPISERACSFGILTQALEKGSSHKISPSLFTWVQQSDASFGAQIPAGDWREGSSKKQKKDSVQNLGPETLWNDSVTGQQSFCIAASFIISRSRTSCSVILFFPGGGDPLQKNEAPKWKGQVLQLNNNFKVVVPWTRFFSNSHLTSEWRFSVRLNNHSYGVCALPRSKPTGSIQK